MDDTLETFFDKAISDAVKGDRKVFGDESDLKLMGLKAMAKEADKSGGAKDKKVKVGESSVSASSSAGNSASVDTVDIDASSKDKDTNNVLKVVGSDSGNDGVDQLVKDNEGATLGSKGDSETDADEVDTKLAVKYPAGSVVATVDMLFEAEEEYESSLPDGARVTSRRTTFSRWTFRGCISGHEELDWLVVAFDGYGVP